MVLVAAENFMSIVLDLTIIFVNNKITKIFKSLDIILS